MPTATSNSKHSLTPWQIRLKSHIKGLFTLVPFIYYITFIFQQLLRVLKGKKTQSEETGQASEPDSGMAEILEWEGQEFKITVINMLKALMKKSRQHARTDG